jgi:aspartate carbamoyltransferase catalytic subunit
LENPQDLLTSRGVPWKEVDDLREVAADVDVLYMTRIQKERFKDMQVRAVHVFYGTVRCRL